MNTNAENDSNSTTEVSNESIELNKKLESELSFLLSSGENEVSIKLWTNEESEEPTNETNTIIIASLRQLRKVIIQRREIVIKNLNYYKKNRNQKTYNKDPNWNSNLINDFIEHININLKWNFFGVFAKTYQEETSKKTQDIIWKIEQKLEQTSDSESEGQIDNSQELLVSQEIKVKISEYKEKLEKWEISLWDYKYVIDFVIKSVNSNIQDIYLIPLLDLNIFLRFKWIDRNKFIKIVKWAKDFRRIISFLSDTTPQNIIRLIWWIKNVENFIEIINWVRDINQLIEDINNDSKSNLIKLINECPSYSIINLVNWLEIEDFYKYLTYTNLENLIKLLKCWESINILAFINFLKTFSNKKIKIMNDTTNIESLIMIIANINSQKLSKICEELTSEEFVALLCVCHDNNLINTFRENTAKVIKKNYWKIIANKWQMPFSILRFLGGFWDS